jgi:predicted  nucleic acid-binding Zn-ribbon protein
MLDTLEVLNAEMQKSKDTWKRIQSHLVADVGRAHDENARLTQAMASRNAETEKLKQERDAAVRRHRQTQEELGPLQLELSVAVKDLKKT